MDYSNSNELRHLVDTLAQHAEGLTRAELLRALRNRWPHLLSSQLENFLKTAGQAVAEREGRFFAATVTQREEEAKLLRAPTALRRRFVAFDLESVVRPVVTEPYKEQHVFQVGAVRFGPDRDWTEEERFFNAHTTLPNAQDELLIHSENVRERYLAHKEPISNVLDRFRAFCEGAEVLVAYNGIGQDFPLLAKEYERAGLEPLWDEQHGKAPGLVDGLYLAQALWPIPPRQHRLRELLERLRVQVEDLVWHDALDDARMLVALLSYGARRHLPTLGEGIVALLHSAGAGSDAWQLLFSLAGIEDRPRRFLRPDVGHAVATALARKAGKEPLRPEAANLEAGTEPKKEDMGMGSLAVFLPPELVGAEGKVDIERLIRTVKGDHAETRPAQRDMLSQIRAWVASDSPALVEAPTGTGKSLAILAAALDWLAANPRNKVVVSTYTKQLQSQLAADIEALAHVAIPELSRVSDMVKGAANRLSLRALVIALAELTDDDPTRRRRGRLDFSDDPRFRDLALYVLLRFLAEGTPTEEWEARSVDKVDIPGFFEDYCPRRLSLYLASLSQADSGDYSSGRGEVARYTRSVREALETSRLVIANHALLLAHLDDFEGLGERTLLFIDEAHELENAATQAISAELDFGHLGRLVTDVTEWLDDQPRSAALDPLAEAIEALERYLDDARLQRAAMRAFDVADSDPLVRGALRTVTVASPVQGDAYLQVMEVFAHELATAARWLGQLRAALRTVPGPEDTFEHDRLLALRARVADADAALGQVVADLDAILGSQALPEWDGTGPRGSVLTGEAAADGSRERGNEATREETVAVGDGDEGDELVGVDDDLGLLVEGEPPEEGEDPEPPQERPNRVVWAEEVEELRPGGTRFYRFRVASSPIELGRERAWAELRERFRRTYYVSATLRVAGSWDFIRRRLALPDDEVRAIELPSPFDPARQAELVCFEDFPSWSEHKANAMRTVAWQLSGYAREILNGDQNGAMVLTTARATAAGIFDDIARLRVAAGAAYPVFSAGLEGNQRAVEAFRREGGILVGTRGLWQGVDVAEPERLRLVWINKLPFASFGDPVISARLALERERAEAAGEEDPDGYANEHYYLPLAALALRQAVGRLIRTRRHRGVVVISDRKLAGPSRLRRIYRQVFLGSLDPGLTKRDRETEELGLGNVCTMREGWRRIFAFLGREGIIPAERVEELSSQEALEKLTELPEMREILAAQLSEEEITALSSDGRLSDTLVERCLRIARLLDPDRKIEQLKPEQDESIRALADGKDALCILPTGFGKSYIFQLPALALPGVTIVVSPLVSLMTDQALGLNRTIGGRVRALVAPMRESNSRTGKAEVQQQLLGERDHGIKLVYLSPERLCQRQFQDWVRAGVERGIVRRIALDEAHTFVQWGDDFRPALRRAENFLRALKDRYPKLQLLALTATANESVREGLRLTLFSLRPGERRENFAFVQANPLRPELAVYRRVLPRHLGGPFSVAGLIERVVEKVDGHAIFYCLTVRQVNEVYNHLIDYLHGHPVEVLRYHGQMTDAERTAVANAFSRAPRQGEEGFRRMVVVATSAFGLGIDRPDIRVVFCVSPPTDLAALHQQLGRAGRDRAGRPGEAGLYACGLALMYPRANRTISFMTRSQISNDLFARIAASLLAASSPLSMAELAEDLIAEDLRAGRLNADQAADAGTMDVYQAAVVRTLAELHRRGALDDLGDFPEQIEVRVGDYAPDTRELVELVEAVLAETPRSRVVATAVLHARLEQRFGADYPDAGALWSAMLELHALGYLDVSQRPNRRMLTAVEHRSAQFPADIVQGLTRRQAQVTAEVELLRGWFSDGACCQEGFRQYFDADALPPGTCSTLDNRCSAHWAASGFPPEEVEPAVYKAFMADDLRPASASTDGRRRAEQQLDRLVSTLLWHEWRGLVENLLLAVLRGEDHFYSYNAGRRIKMWPSLLLSSTRGRKPGLRREDLRASLSRLVDRGEVVRQGARYRLARHAAREEERLAAEREKVIK